MSNEKINKKSEINFETAMKRLEEISSELEKESVSLEESLALYEEGVALVRKCNQQLENAERKVKLLKMTSDGEMLEEDFLADGSAE